MVPSVEYFTVVIDEPPVAFNVKESVPDVPVPPSVNVPIVGAYGTESGVVEAEAEDALDVP